MPTSRVSPGALWSSVSLGVLAATFSLTGSWIPSLWGDEAASLLSASRPLSSLFPMLGHVDAVHGTYYLALHFWVEVAGTSPFALRLPSALAIGGCVVGLVLLGDRLDSLALGLVAGAICAVLPRITLVGEEARSYAFTAATATWLTLLLVRLIDTDRPKIRLWVAYACLLTIGVYVFLYFFLIALAHLVILLISTRRAFALRNWLIATCAAVVAAAPLLVLAFLERRQISYLSSAPQVSFHSVTVQLWFGSAPFAVVSWVLIVTALVGILIDRHRDEATPLGRVTWVGGCWLILPGAILVLSSTVVAAFTSRYLAMCAPAAALLMGTAIVRVCRRRTAWMAVGTAAVVALGVPVWASQRGPFSMNDSDWAQISANLSTRTHVGDAVVFDESARPSKRPRLAMRTYPAGFSGLRDVTLKTPYYANITWYDAAYTVTQASALGRFAGVRTVWLIEYATSTHVDTYGMSELRNLGFVPTTRIRDYRSVIVQFSRVASQTG